jgi:hypothetical protein
MLWTVPSLFFFIEVLYSMTATLPSTTTTTSSPRLYLGRMAGISTVKEIIDRETGLFVFFILLPFFFD